MRRLRRGLSLPGLGLSVVACQAVPTLQRNLVEPSRIVGVPAGAYLKAHLRSGEVLVFSTWTVDTVARVVSGSGQRLDVNRQADTATTHAVPLDSVALFESNVVQRGISGLTVLTGGSILLGVICAANPKACFGSCPTFYVDDGSRPALQAEGFSASVAPSLEATDIDALYHARAPTTTRFAVRMTNEALETHVVRWVRLLAVERPEGGRVFATQNGEFWRASTIASPTRCRAADGECLAAVREMDGIERFSLADSTDLAAREVIDLEFPRMTADQPAERSGRDDDEAIGLVIGSRQTLLSTFLLYQTLAFMGRSATGFLAALETHAGVRSRAHSLARKLGGIEVQARDARGRWRTIGETQETGPLATDVRVVVLRMPSSAARHLRLRLTRGHWRVDYVAIARLRGQGRPLSIDPIRVTRRGRSGEDPAREDTDALAALRDTTRFLVTYPGDEFVLHYLLPPRNAATDYELFLESRGYYLEWMRDEWLADENPARAFAILSNPARALRDLAPEFKRREAGLERTFWNSRYARP